MIEISIDEQMNDWYLNNSINKYIVRAYRGAVNHDKEATMDRLIELQRHEREARRSRAEYGGDLIVRAAIALDLTIRRVAYRVLSSPARAAREDLSRPNGRLWFNSENRPRPALGLHGIVRGFRLCSELEHLQQHCHAFERVLFRDVVPITTFVIFALQGNPGVCAGGGARAALACIRTATGSQSTKRAGATPWRLSAGPQRRMSLSVEQTAGRCGPGGTS
jgi:hypothetical protein